MATVTTTKTNPTDTDTLTRFTPAESRELTRALSGMPYSGLCHFILPVATVEDVRLNLVTLSQVLAGVAKRGEEADAELATFRQWQQTLREIAAAIVG